MRDSGIPQSASQKCTQNCFSGLHLPENDLLKPIEGETHDEMVMLKDIPFYSICEHHLLPFIGKAHIAYIPAGQIVGLSDLVKALEHFANRPQVQERLTTQLADIIMKQVRPKGCMVIIDAEHLCMSMRGIKKNRARAPLRLRCGHIRSRQTTREEMLALLNNHHQ